jgi:PAS domain S-box-containing protein
MLFELESDAILLVDNGTGLIVEANAAASQLYGYAAGELRGMRNTDLSAEPAETRRVMDATPPDQAAVVTVPLRFHRKKDGTVFPAEITGRFFMDGGRSMHIAAIRDITSRWQAERALQESEERFRTILEHAPDGVFVEVDRRFAYVNAATLRLFGASSPEDLLGAPVLDRVHPDYRDLVGERIRLLETEHRSAPPTEQVYLRLDASSVPVEASAAPITYLHKPGGLVFARDITQRKRLEAELVQAQKLDSIGRIAGGIAHDFNNMLNVIGGYTEMALVRLRSEDPLRAQLLEVKQAADRATDLTRQLLAFSRRQPSAPRLLELNQRLRSSEGMMKRLLGESVRLQLDLWKGSAIVKIDPAQLDQLLVNLLANAKDALSGYGSVRVETDVVTIGDGVASSSGDCAPGPYVVLAVTDNGCGMDDETRAHLFEPFFTTKGPLGCSGLGLAVVYGVVRQHLGCIDVASEVGRGTTVRVLLPRQETVSLPVLRDGTPAASAATVGQEVVLVVEDEDQVRRLVVTALERGGYTVLQSGSPDAALELARETPGPIHLLLTDVIMPGMDGAELQRRLERVRTGFRTLFMSGYASNIIGEHGVLDDGICFIQKPFSVIDLMRKVREVLA